MLNNHIEAHCARSPWWGGWWGRLVHSVKSALKKFQDIKYLSRVELETCLSEVEMCVNSRPLTFVGDGIDNLAPLGPSHFLIGKCGTSKLEPVEEYIPEELFEYFKGRYGLLYERL